MDEQSAIAPVKAPGQYFSPLQIGSIVELIPFFPVESGVLGAFSAVRTGREVVLVARKGKLFGLIPCGTLEKILNRGGTVLPDLTAYLIPPLGIVDAFTSLDAVMARYIKGEAGNGAGWFVVLHKESYLGVVGLRKIIEYTNTMRVRDLVQAGEIQRHLLDKSRVTDPRFRVLLYNKMAHELGGDFYRVFRSDRDRYLIGCFDVAGKNISGSLATMSLGACFSALELLTFKGCPEEITRFINSLVRDVSPPGLFITAVLFYVDFTTGTVTIHNCGFSPALIFAPRDTRIAYKVLQPSLPPLGIQEELALETGQTIPIRPGLRLTAYSDGLTDMTNIHRERYGEERTFTLLKKFQRIPQPRLRELLEKEIALWIGEEPGAALRGASLADDVTLVDIRFG
ncbi:hypothetical protein AGMMS49942_12090 [Spirochaetia bacterium]|nr:hypothetical protein AGMMS49942_12090 [Spirochaetia bacterium]